MSRRGQNRLMTIRKAELQDVPVLAEMINHYARERILLPRSLPELYECVREFVVAEEDGVIVGCGALKFYNAELAEIRSLCVAPGVSHHGVGRAVVEDLIAEAEQRRLKTVFALTMAPAFFQKCGFRETIRERLPQKVWRDCLRCEKYFCCDEKAFVFDLVPRDRAEVEASAEASEVPA